MIRTFTVLGGGSAYAPGLLQALLRHPGTLGLESIRLYDLDPARAQLIARLGTGLSRAAGSGLRIEAAGTLEDAIRGTDAILNSTRPGGLEARRVDETLPLAFGVPGQETVGPGGFFYALRSIPEALRAAALRDRLAPGAWWLNYTNPSNIVSQALLDQGHGKVIGLCDQSAEDLHALAEASGRTGDWTFACSGLNHATWYSGLEMDGRPWAPPPGLAPPEGLDAEHRLRFVLSAAMAAEHPGFWPNSYLPYYRDPQAFVALARQGPPRSEVILKALPDYYAHFEAEAARDRPELRKHRGAAGFGDLAVTVLEALQGERPAPLVLNLPDGGATGLFAPDTVAELPAALSRAGAAARPAGPLPPGTEGLLRRLEDYQRLTAQAAVLGGGARLEAALAANPLVPDAATARALLREARSRYGGLLEALA
ncbi:MAG TPA: hypothetical protein VFM16_00990 [Holophagaceae bacterium]|nr:hypothetical protein [Holophagaceae bacterium]